MTHFVHMKRIGVWTLHLNRRMGAPRGARRGGGDHRPRAPVASLLPVRPGDLSTPFGERCTLPEFDALPPVSCYSGAYVSQDRDRG